MDDIELTDLIDEADREEEEEEVRIGKDDLSSLTVYSRDWTVETIISQVRNGNIDLDPEFQRRNAWNDGKRSKLVESLISFLPVPELVLAEDPKRKRSFLVIDGKQRLLAIMGFVEPAKFKYWRSPKLGKELTIRKDLKGKTYADLASDPALGADLRQFLNADIRCTIISNFGPVDVLYDIFYRLNTGSVQLSSQELRQVLNKGEFAKFLIKSTNEPGQPLQTVLGLKGPDSRLGDIEIALRYFSIILFGKEYNGNLRKFLDDSMGKISRDWPNYEGQITDLYNELQTVAINLTTLLGAGHVGKKLTDGNWERFNRALFEVEAYYCRFLKQADIEARRSEFMVRFTALLNDEDFRTAISAATHTLPHFETRFRMYQAAINDVFNLGLDNVPVELRDELAMAT